MMCEPIPEAVLALQRFRGHGCCGNACSMCRTLGAVLQGHGKADSEDEDSDSSHPQSPDATREPGSVCP